MRIIDRMLGVEEFVAVADAGSFVAAAQKLGLTSSGVGKAVQRLEGRLGVRLFTRTTRRVALTEDGALFLERCQSILRDLDDAEDEINARRSEIAGLIRVAAPQAYGRLLVVPLLAGFMQIHPEVRIDAQLSDKLADAVEERLDLIVRIGELEDSSMWAKRIDTIRFGVFAAPAYLQMHGVPAAPEALEHHVRLGFTLNSGKPLAFTLQNETGHLSLPPTDAFMSNDIEGTIAAAQAGSGLAYLPVFIARNAVDAGVLQPVLKAHWIDGGPVHLLYPQPRHMPRRVRVLADYLIAKFRAELD
jgi:LysR family transcriptional regulator, regulator for bpeEF and oprC